MSKTAGLVGLLLAVGLGFAWGTHSVGEPQVVTKTETIRVPEVKTHIETKEVATPMPQSCKTAIDMLLSTSPELDTASSSAGQIVLDLNEAAIRLATDDIAKMNEMIQKVRDERHTLDGASVGMKTDFTLLQQHLTQCQSDIGTGS